MARLTVGGCAELSSTVHRLVFHLATQAGKWEAKDSGEEVEECILVQKQRIGRRIARQVWRDIHQHSKARRRFVGPRGGIYPHEREGHREAGFC